MKKVLFFDIDGTLLNSELKIPEGVKRELKRLKEAGHYLFVASGRPLAFISNQIIDAGFNGFVLCNGAHVELNHEIIYENRIPYEKVNDLMKSQKNSLHFPYKSDRMSVRNTKEFFLCLNLIAFVIF